MKVICTHSHITVTIIMETLVGYNPYTSSVLENFFITLLAAARLTALVTSGGAKFHSLAQSMLMLSLAAFINHSNTIIKTF